MEHLKSIKGLHKSVDPIIDSMLDASNVPEFLLAWTRRITLALQQDVKDAKEHEAAMIAALDEHAWDEH